MESLKSQRQPSQKEISQKRIMVQRLLSEIYNRYHLQKQLDSSTETSCLSDGYGIHGHATDEGSALKHEQHKLKATFLKSKEADELYAIKHEFDERISVMSAKLVRQLKQRNRLRDKNKRYCDTITAVLQAVSKKRKVDAKLQFNMEPQEGEEGFKQWCDALRAIIRLPGGMPSCWRKRIWMCLADHYMETRLSPGSTMRQTLNRVFSDRVCPADESLSNQIVKDLHRTGHTNISSDRSSVEDRLVLKRVLLAYARWNQSVGYCQGFNVLAALILQVTEGDDEAAFKIMVYLVDGVLPENYFANNLQALSVDMAVFRDLMRVRLPQLSRHLDDLQKEANETSTGSNYEPPLTNVFTMQWFLTLFATCLPSETVLRIWDGVMLDGSEILLRVALAIWSKLGEKIGETQSADEFYCNMAMLMQGALNGKLINSDELVRLSYRIASFPFPHLKQLREKYTYNITPFAAEDAEDLKDSDYSPSHDTSISGHHQSLDDMDDSSFFCFTGLVPTLPAPALQERKKANKQSLDLANNRERLGEAYSVQRGNGMMAERMSTDIAALKNQYMSIRSRQLRAHLVYTKPAASPRAVANKTARPVVSAKVPVPVMVNHLLIGRNQGHIHGFAATSVTTKSGHKSGKRTKPPKNIHGKGLLPKSPTSDPSMSSSQTSSGNESNMT